MVKLINAFKVVYPGEALCELYADAKSEVVPGMTVEGLPDTYTIAAGSTVSTADFDVARIDSTGTWHWL